MDADAPALDPHWIQIGSHIAAVCLCYYYIGGPASDMDQVVVECGLLTVFGQTRLNCVASNFNNCVITKLINFYISLIMYRPNPRPLL